jgi:tetratricopeptide (TPR) repeat protein
VPIDRRALALAALLVGLIFAAYAPALRGGFTWDDDAHIYENKTLDDLSGLRAIWLTPGSTMQYYPLTFTCFWIGRHLWGLDPLGYHLLNVAMHAAAALLLWRLLLRLRVPGAFAGACLFALHPVNVMTVAWVTELKNTLAATLALASGLAYLRFAGEPARRRLWYAASLVLFTLAMLAKTAVGFLPVTLGLVAWWRRDRVTWRDIVPLAPFALLVAGMGAMTIVVERLHGGDTGRGYAMTLAERLIVSGRSFWFYLGKLAFPYPLSFLYERWTIDARDALQYLPAVAAIALAAVLISARRRIGKGPLVAMAHFFVGTSSALIFFVVTYFTRYSFVSDHWQYFGMPAVAALGGAGLAWLWDALPPKAGLAAGRSLAVVVVGALWISTALRAAVYENVETLWRDTIAKSPGAWMAHNNLGVLLMRRGATQEAIEEYGEALRLKPDLVEAHLNLANILTGEGRVETAMTHYREAIRLDPESAEAHFDLGRALAGQGRDGDAMAEYLEALRLRPNYAEADNSVGVALIRSGNKADGIERLERAVRAKPDYVDARVNLGDAFAATGRLDDAIAQYAEALRLGSNRAAVRYNLGRALARSDRTAEAVEQYVEALKLEPGLAEASNSLGMALASMDRWTEAIERFRAALRDRPDFAEAHNNLGIALVRSGLLPEAIEQFQSAIRLRPEFDEARANLERAQDAMRARRDGSHP